VRRRRCVCVPKTRDDAAAASRNSTLAGEHLGIRNPCQVFRRPEKQRGPIQQAVSARPDSFTDPHESAMSHKWIRRPDTQEA